ncbi:MAG: hypothetical protein QOJ05_1436 [Verrucomicrobiota bacterium]
MLTGRRVWVNAFVKLGSHRKNQRQKERREDSARGNELEVSSVLFHCAATLPSEVELRKHDLRPLVLATCHPSAVERPR